MARTAQERRANAREARRAAAAPPPVEESLADAVEAAKDDPSETLRTAASAAIAAAAVGAAQAIARRRHGDDERDGLQEDEVHEAEPDEPEPEEPEPDEPEPEPASAPRAAAPGEAGRIVERAREQLRELRGTDAETVSSVRRTEAGWRVGLELVEVHRIPESTDVLGTYEVELDDDGNLVTFERTARYYRSEADRR